MRHPSNILAAICLCSVASLSIAQNQDPFLWLEDVTGDKALDWVKLRNQETRNKLDNDAGFQQLRGQLQTILDSKIEFLALLRWVMRSTISGWMQSIRAVYGVKRP